MKSTLAILIFLPWVNPFSPGPTPAALPLLFSWTCMALAAIAIAWRKAGPSSILKSAAPALLAAALVNASLGLMQYFGATGWAGVWIDHTGFGEAYGNLRQRNQYASLMGIGLAAVFWWASQPRAVLQAKPLGNLPSSIQAPLIIGSGVLLGFGNAASSSRTGLIQWIVVCCVAVLWQRRSLSLKDRLQPDSLVYGVAFAALAAYAIATVALPWIAGLDPNATGAWARLQKGDALCNSRATLWANVVHLISIKPWFGWGWGELDYAHFMTLYPGPRFCDILDNAHNLPLHVAVEFGVPAAAVLCGAVIWLIKALAPLHETNSDLHLAWSILIVIGIHSLLEYPLWYGPFQTAALLGLWCLVHPLALPGGHKMMSARTISTTRFFVIGLASLGLAFCAFATWQYQLASQIYLPTGERLGSYKEDTLEKIRNVKLYQDQVRFADLTTTELDTRNAEAVNALAKEMLHFSPEPKVIELLLDSAELLGRTDEVTYFSERYRAAFPDRHQQWLTKTTLEP
jgi:O-antigen ligase